jgi:hypothetical protein
MLNPEQRRRRRHRQGAGFTLPSFAEHYGLSLNQVRLAVKRGEIKTVEFAGLQRIPPSEAERIARLFDLSPVVDEGEGNNGVDHQTKERRR